MSILIKGMEMPTSCVDCKLRMAVGCCGNLPHNTRMPNCALVELPPHGRLIDADALIKPKNQHIDVLADEWYVTVKTIETAPTIIEAEGEE